MEPPIENLKADSRQPCNCIDCDGKWCVWCFEHHGRKPCPFVESVRKELRL